MITESTSPTLDASLTPRASATSASASSTRSWQTRPSSPLAVLCWPITPEIARQICAKGSLCLLPHRDGDPSTHYRSLRCILPSIICDKYPSAPYWPDGTRLVEMDRGSEFALIVAGNWGRQCLIPLPDPEVVDTIADMLCLEGAEREPRWLTLGSTPRFKY